jgi:adenylate cyclase
MAEERAQRRLAAILAIDVVGYSRLMENDEAGTLAALKALHKTVLEPLITDHQGRIFKLMGDGVLVEFASAVNAVECAVALQSGLAPADDGLPPDKRIEIRIGINLGDVLVEGDDLYGDGVNIAARLQELAEPGGICVSSKLRDEVGSKLKVAFHDLGEQRLKNISSPVRVCRLRAGGREPTSTPTRLPLPDKPSIAILPFDNLSGDPEQQYFSDGISEDIITDLSKISGLFVIARNSAFTFRGKSAKTQDVSRELGVRYVLEGSVRRAGNRVRITTQLVDGTTGGHVWAERYDRDLTDFFAVQDEVTHEIVAALAIKLTPDEHQRLVRKGTDNLEAYDHLVRGTHLTFQVTKETNVEAGRLLERAIELDPHLARAFTMLSHVHVLAYVNGWREQPEALLQRAFELALQAVALDNDDPDGHWNLGIAYLWRRRHDLATAAERRALHLNPNFASAHAALGNILYYSGRSSEAVEPLLMAMRLDPYYSEIWLHFLALAYFGMGRYDDAAAILKRRIIRRPDTDISRVLLAACYGYIGRGEEARALWQEALRLNPQYSLEQKRRILPYKNSGDFERLLDGLHKAGLPE